MNSDGTNRQVLTNDGTAGARTTRNPTFSQDGRIFFQSDRAQQNVPQIYSMNQDGSGQTALTSGPGANRDPDVSPDGKQVVFVSTRDDPTLHRGRPLPDERRRLQPAAAAGAAAAASSGRRSRRAGCGSPSRSTRPPSTPRSGSIETDGGGFTGRARTAPRRSTTTRRTGSRFPTAASARTRRSSAPTTATRSRARPAPTSSSGSRRTTRSRAARARTSSAATSGRTASSAAPATTS